MTKWNSITETTIPNKTDYRTMFDRNYLGHLDLAGREVTLTIAKVVGGELTAEGGRKSRKPIVHFGNGVKPLIVNKTNAKTIASLYGTFVQDWSGKRITLFTSMTRNPDGGGQVECVRIRPKLPGDQTDTHIDAPPEPEERIIESATPAPELAAVPSQEDAGAQAAADLITADQAIDIGDKLAEAGIAKERFLKATKVASIGMLPAAAYSRAVDWIDKARSTK